MKKETLTRAEINQLLAYCEERDKDGWYYGNKKQFENRHKQIIKKLKSTPILKDEK